MGRAFLAILWVVVGTVSGVVIGLMLGLVSGGVMIAVFRPRGDAENVVGCLTFAVACGTCTVVGALIGTTGGLVWGLQAPGYRPQLDDLDRIRAGDGDRRD